MGQKKFEGIIYTSVFPATSATGEEEGGEEEGALLESNGLIWIWRQ